MQKTRIEHYWRRYLQDLPPNEDPKQSYLVEQFGDRPELADELGSLVLSGAKTATSSALWEWEAEDCPLPTIGLKTVVLNGSETPICIIATTEVSICAFNQVDTQFAYDEGENDRTLESWRREHWQYFSRVLPKIGKTPDPNMLLVCERFRVVSVHRD